jgi:8-hydroxy-5-deazaflavin:NADPH oxidoreductase
VTASPAAQPGRPGRGDLGAEPLRGDRFDEEQAVDDVVGIAGGTGALGRGLARRLAAAGVAVRLGSRDADRGRGTAEEVAGSLPAGSATVVGGGNEDLAGCRFVLLAVPYDSLDATLDVLAPADGCIVISAVNPLGFDDRGPHALATGEVSLAERVAERLPAARVTGAFHSVSSYQLARTDEPMDDDVAVVGDDEEAIEAVVALADRVEGCRGVAVGPLRLAGTLEVLTPVLIAINKRHRTHAGIRFSGLDPD